MGNRGRLMSVSDRRLAIHTVNFTIFCQVVSFYIMKVNSLFLVYLTIGFSETRPLISEALWSSCLCLRSLHDCVVYFKVCIT